MSLSEFISNSDSCFQKLSLQNKGKVSAKSTHSSYGEQLIEPCNSCLSIFVEDIAIPHCKVTKKLN